MDENLLSQALRAQAAGMPGRERPRLVDARGARLSAGWVLLIALVLGLLAGAAAGLVTVL
jgi:hypothetical protein